VVSLEFTRSQKNVRPTGCEIHIDDTALLVFREACRWLHMTDKLWLLISILQWP